MLAGQLAIYDSVTRDTSPKPTVISFVPPSFALVAAVMAVLSLPPTVCTPSDSSIITFGTPERAPVPHATEWPRSMPPDRKVSEPTAGALSSLSVMMANDAVSAMCVTVVVWNSTYAI